MTGFSNVLTRTFEVRWRDDDSTRGKQSIQLEGGMIYGWDLHWIRYVGKINFDKRKGIR